MGNAVMQMFIGRSCSFTESFGFAYITNLTLPRPAQPIFIHLSSSVNGDQRSHSDLKTSNPRFLYFALRFAPCLIIPSSSPSTLTCVSFRPVLRHPVVFKLSLGSGVAACSTTVGINFPSHTPISTFHAYQHSSDTVRCYEFHEMDLTMLWSKLLLGFAEIL